MKLAIFLLSVPCFRIATAGRYTTIFHPLSLHQLPEMSDPLSHPSLPHNMSSVSSATNMTRLSLTNYGDHDSIELAFRILNVFLGLSIVLSILLNAPIVMASVKNRNSCSSFNVLIANLCLGEVLLACTGMTGIFIRGLYGYFPFGPVACSFFLYCNNVFNGCVHYGHVLIAVNRVWAVTYPVHYRRHNRNLRFTFFSILVVFLCLNALHLSVIVPGRMWPIPNDTLCTTNVQFQRRAALVVEILGFTITEVLVVGLSGFVWWKIAQRNRSKARVSASVPTLSHSKTGNSLELGTLSKTRNPSNEVTHPSQQATDIHGSRNENSSDSEAARRRRGRSRAHNRVLGYLVMAVIVCWTPNHVYWLMVDIAGYWNTMFMVVQFFLLYLNSWINPLLCYAALKELRQAVRRIIL